MFDVSSETVKIDGSKGVYDGKPADESARYGRNAVDNFYTYLEKPVIADPMNAAPILDFGIKPDAFEKNAEKIGGFLKENDNYLKSLPPLEFEYRYMPSSKLDTKAVLGAAYEEMGGVKEIGVEEFDKNFMLNGDFTSKALDINKDGKIDISEYGSSILAADMFSKSDVPDAANIDGTINKKGLDAVLAYARKSNTAAAEALYAKIYKNSGLAEEMQSFKETASE